MQRMSGHCWKKLACPSSQLCLETVLVGGQSFRWRQNDDQEWLGVIAGRVWRLKQTDHHLLYQAYPPFDNDLKIQIKNPNGEIPADGKNVASRKKSADLKSELPKPLSRVNRRNVKLLSSSKLDADSLSEKDIKTENVPSVDVSSISAYAQGGNGVVRKESLDKSLLKNIKTEDSCNSNIAQNDPTDQASDLVADAVLTDYFQLNIDLSKLYDHWSRKDSHFREMCCHFPGIRILRQDPVENLLSFVCSSNNHISRITSMIDKLCMHYGDPIAKVDGVQYHNFPTFEALSGVGVELKLRELGFGYRAKFISSIAQDLAFHKEKDWLYNLRGRSYVEAKEELMSLLGVGAKVADCVCLMSLDKPGSLPVDTHVWQITERHYMAKLSKAKSLTTKLYDEIGDFYRELWGPYAGWAHSVLFIADLKQNMDKATGKRKAVDSESKGDKAKRKTKKAENKTD